MYKLSGHSLTKDVWFEPESQGMTLSERDSTTSITLGPDAPEIGFDEWILDDRWPEGNYVWRVKSLGDQTNTETRTTELEHVIKILDDIKLFGEVTTADLAGQSGASTVTAKKAVQYILNKCSDWTLGTFEYDDVSNPYEFNGDSLYDALETITETLEDAVWTYSLGSYPFKLNIVHRSDAVACEMRAGRNLSTLKRQVNRSGMYTRIYPIGKNDLHIDGNYLSKNENLYGRIDQIETDQSKSTKANLRAWAQARLNRHCEPTMTITISGLELSSDTGEDLDRLKLNRVCQCPLPNSSTVIDEKIVKLQWRDRLKEPENVTVNLCNSSADVATIIKQQSRGGGKAAAGQAKQNYLFEANGQHLYYEIFDECGHLHGMLEMTSESLRIAFDNEIASTRSEFLMTSESLRIMFENEIASTRSEFEMTSESLRIAFENEIASTRSEFEMTSESLRIQFENDLASTRSEFQMTSESMRVHFENEISSTRSEMQMTSESLRIAFDNEIASTRSEFLMTSESLRIMFENEIASTRSEFEMTSESLRIAFENEIASTRSEFEMTSESLRIQFENDLASTRSEFQMTSESMRVHFENEISSTRSEMQMTSESLRIAFEAGQSSLRSEFNMTAASLRIEFQSADSSIRSLVTQTASSWEAKISGVTGSDGKVTAASIAVAINNAGEGVATINASKIYLLGQTIADQITADYISTKIATLSSLTVASMNCTGTIGASTVEVGTLKFRSSSGSGYSYSDLKDLFVTSVAVEGPVNNVYTLKYYTANGTGTSGGTFSRAVSEFTGTWSGNHYYVTVSPQGQSGGDTYLFSEADEWTEEYKKTVHVYYFSGSTHVDVLTAVVNASSIFDLGVAEGESHFTRQTITLQGSQTSELTLQGSAATTQQVTLQGTQTSELTLQGTAQTVYEEVSSGGTVYYTAGTATTYYNAGTTTKYARGDTVTVTLQGSQTSELTLQGTAQTVYEEVSSGGTVYYTAGTAVTRYYGNGSSVTGRGDSVSIQEIGNAVHFKRHTSGTPSGTWYTIVSSGYDLTYYLAKTAATYYKGNGSSVTGRGTSESITPIGSTSKRLSSVTRYKAGTNVGKLYNAGTVATYYQGNGGSFTVQGSSVSVTPIGSTSKRLSSVTRYKAGTNVGKLYNAGEIATVYPATQTLYKAGTNIGKLYNAGTISNSYYTKNS